MIKGKKRLLYEDLAVDEDWIVDVQNVRIIAFAVASGGEVNELLCLRFYQD